MTPTPTEARPIRSAEERAFRLGHECGFVRADTTSRSQQSCEDEDWEEYARTLPTVPAPAEVEAVCERLEVRHVRQQHPFGCQVAVCAMLLGLSYEEALALYPYAPKDDSGFGPHMLDDILANRGVGLVRRHRFSAQIGKHRDPWPPEPFADVHWCLVVNEHGGHAVVMLRDGTVLDPSTDEPRRLSDYREVHSVAGVLRSLAAQQAGEWRGIESAPKDEWIVGRRMPGDHAPAFVGKITKVFGKGNWLINEWTGVGARFDAWMPLPAPPSAPDRMGENDHG